MRRRLSAVALLAAVAIAAPLAQAAPTRASEWEASITGKQTVSWSFAADRPEQCTAYYGTSSEAAKGSGTVKLTFATAKKKPIAVWVHLVDGRLQVTAFATDGYKLPATWTKQGSFVLSRGKPCGSDDDDPVPLPIFSDASGCGTKTLTFEPSLTWTSGKLVLLGTLWPMPSVACPGVYESAMQADTDAPCTPKGRANDTDGTSLQEIRTAVSAKKFAAGKAFTVDVDRDDDCGYPSTWPGNPSLKVDLRTTYHVTFKRHKR